MCGIAGFFGWDRQSPVPESALKRASDSMALRGPDAAGVCGGSGFQFVHRRLSIIDLTGGTQPLTDPDSGLVLTYNGEIYNFRELRTELAAKGHVFETHCDTEVVLRAWIEWGSACMDRLRGIFAFAVYDPRSDELFLVRDRMGVKPLYYACTQDGIVFASTVTALLSFDGVGRKPDDAALMHYMMTIRSVMGSHTLFESIKTLEAGTFGRARRGSMALDVSAYWNFPVVSQGETCSASEEELTERVEHMVRESVHEQMVSDVPLGGFLSGGIDSTIIASVASSFGEFGAYSVGYDDYDCHEWPYVRQAAEAFGVNCRELHLELGDYIQTWRFLLAQKGMPLSTPNEVPIYRLARALRQDYTVALSGEGADEIFGGYVIPYFSSFDYDRSAADASPQVQRAMMRLYGQPGFGDHAEHHFLLNSWIQPRLRSQILNPDFDRRAADVTDHYRGLFARFDGCSTLDKQMHVHARVNLEGLLNRVDSSTMAASVEARVPFTDHRLAELLFTTPDAYRIHWAGEAERIRARVMNAAEIDRYQLVESKRLLRSAFSKQVPESILTRRKVSFAVPFREWLGGPLRSQVGGWIRESSLVERLVCPEAIEELLDGPGGAMAGMILWPLANLALWERGLSA